MCVADSSAGKHSRGASGKVLPLRGCQCFRCDAVETKFSVARSRERAGHHLRIHELRLREHPLLAGVHPIVLLAHITHEFVPAHHAILVLSMAMIMRSLKNMVWKSSSLLGNAPCASVGSGAMAP